MSLLAWATIRVVTSTCLLPAINGASSRSLWGHLFHDGKISKGVRIDDYIIQR